MNNRKKKTKALDDSSSEVDDLLRAAEDHLLLNLRLNSHSKSQNPFTSSSSLDSDLARRFDALKSPSNPNPSSTPLKKSPPSDEELSGILGDDLAARFAALKGSVGAAEAAAAPDLGLEGVSDGGKFYEESDDGDRDGDGVSKKEVEKLVQWAKDAARLDPSSKDDDDEIDDDDVSEDNDDDDSDDSEQERIKEKNMKSKGKPKS